MFDRERYVSLYHRVKPKHPIAQLENCRTDDMLARILNKIEGTNKLIKEMKLDMLALNQTIYFHSSFIKQLEMQLSNINFLFGFH